MKEQNSNVLGDQLDPHTAGLMAWAGIDPTAGAEARGGRTLAKSELLPNDMADVVKQSATAQALGFVVGSTADDLFTNVQLPAGWTKGVTPDDSYGRSLAVMDSDGKVRGTIFYKAASYDRYANGTWLTRYYVTEWHGALEAPVQDWKANDPTHIVALDRLTNDKIFISGSIPHYTDKTTSYAEREALEKSMWGTVRTWLDASYPNWKDPFTYWPSSEQEPTK